jgi:hypothetical protein
VDGETAEVALPSVPLLSIGDQQNLAPAFRHACFTSQNKGYGTYLDQRQM